MPELRQFNSTPWNQIASVRITQVVERQWGVISRQQGIACGLSPTSIHRWVERGRLHRLYPGVYSFGHRRICIEGQLVAALLFAGDGAALSHTTAAWWWGLVDATPRRIHVSAARRRRQARGICLHRPQRIDAVRHRGFRVTTVARTLLDIS